MSKIGSDTTWAKSRARVEPGGEIVGAPHIPSVGVWGFVIVTSVLRGGDALTTPGELDAFPGTRPVLTASEIDRARPYGRVRQVEIGEILYRPGEVGRPCFLLLSASLEIVQPSIHGERLVFYLVPGMFTGEAGSIAGQRTVVQARVMQAGEVLELRPKSFALWWRAMRASARSS